MPAEENLHDFERHGNNALPHCILCSAAHAGARVVIVGGTHGNEPAGVAAMIEFYRGLAEGKLVLKTKCAVNQFYIPVLTAFRGDLHMMIS